MSGEEPTADTAPREPARRLFFALWPDESMRQAMAQATRKAARASGGRPMPERNLHVTLAFLGSVPERRLPELAEIARAAALRAGLAGVSASVAPAGSAGWSVNSRGRCIELTFDSLEHWRAAHLLCALPAEPPAAVLALARGLQEQLAGGGFTPDLKPFRPHVTVARKVSRPGRMEKMHPVVWSFSGITLIESRTLPEGALYSVVESYALCGEQNAANSSETP